MMQPGLMQPGAMPPGMMMGQMHPGMMPMGAMGGMAGMAIPPQMQMGYPGMSARPCRPRSVSLTDALNILLVRLRYRLLLAR